MMLVVTEMIAHLSLQCGLQHPLGQLAEQPIRADQLDAFLPSLGHQLLGHTLLIESRLDRLLPSCFGCHVVDRVSHGLTLMMKSVDPTGRDSRSVRRLWAVLEEFGPACGIGAGWPGMT
jgi:hypothetical protein